ncbi:thioredoxin [Campylobacter sp. MIT 99-7217]|uniref:TlpA family protein disulfide reductase n=1 Tax=Campylobacter sp. MIT 99-7217 TaxID=535091 RepID=UPI001157DA5B|nr:TlpA disulfide reductase family protein [Campylobacter sp. MIT 99-7217]TQR29570.1 thioredoxin [Campylobacter sp. MIT 99-7217]
MIKKLCVLVLAFLLSSCMQDTKNEGKVGFKASEISAKNLQDESVKLRDFDESVKVLIFFENGCAACIKELPLFDTYLKEHKGQVLALGINSVDSKEVIKLIKDKYNIQNIKLLKDDLDISWQRYKIFALPTTIIIKDNIIKERIIGEKPWSFIESKISSLL